VSDIAAEIHLDVQDEEPDLAALERAVLDFRDELLQLDVDRVEQGYGGEAPPGARAGTVAAVGGLIVTLKPTVEAIAALVGMARAWLARGGGGRKVRIELDGDVLELSGTTAKVQEQLATAWIQRHSTR
jgi:hypothetical protein